MIRFLSVLLVTCLLWHATNAQISTQCGSITLTGSDTYHQVGDYEYIKRPIVIGQADQGQDMNVGCDDYGTFDAPTSLFQMSAELPNAAAFESFLGACNGGLQICTGFINLEQRGWWLTNAGDFLVSTAGAVGGTCSGSNLNSGSCFGTPTGGLYYICRCNTPVPVVPVDVCGDGAVTGAETCDDGNTIAGDGCSATCMQEPGYNCTGAPSTCASICGDGILISGAEVCDDGNTVAGDGCSPSCTVEANYACTTNSPSTCTYVCGNGIKNDSEECDDGNNLLGDGCTPNCLNETGNPFPICGNGLLEGGELCDDGNTVPGDGCDASCAYEGVMDNYVCPSGPSPQCHNGECFFVHTTPTGNYNGGQALPKAFGNAPNLFQLRTDLYPSLSPLTRAQYIESYIRFYPHWARNETTDGDIVRISLDPATYRPVSPPETHLEVLTFSQRCCPTPVAQYQQCSGDTCYLFVSTPMQFSDAEDYCAGINGVVATFASVNTTRGILRTFFGANATIPSLLVSSGNALVNNDGPAPSIIPDSGAHPFMCSFSVGDCPHPNLCPSGIYDACGKCDGDGSECTCGDGIIGEGFPGYAPEECEDGNASNGDGCSDSCRIEANHACSGLPSVCCDYTFPTREVPTPCGCRTPALALPNKEMPHEVCAGQTVPNVVQSPMIFFGERNTSSPGFNYFRARDQCARLNMTLPTHFNYHLFHNPPSNTACLATYDPPTFNPGSPCDGPLRPLGFPDLAMLGPGPVEPSPPPFAGFRSWWRKRNVLPNPPAPTDSCQLYRNDGEGNDGFPPQCQLSDPGFPGAEKFFFACIPFPHPAPTSCTYDRCGVCNGDNSLCCGDGIHQTGEACDDGNTTPGDGCSATCTLEPFSTCTHVYVTEADFCTVCGNGVLETGEACDDSNSGNGDGCSSTCQIEPGFQCTPGCSPICGDGLIRGGEGCDDANTVSGDGCSSACATEGGFNCVGEPSVCSPGSGVCGDGVLNGGEGCDDGNTIAGDGCDASCQVEFGFACPTPGAPCVPAGK